MGCEGSQMSSAAPRTVHHDVGRHAQTPEGIDGPRSRDEGAESNGSQHVDGHRVGRALQRKQVQSARQRGQQRARRMRQRTKAFPQMVRPSPSPVLFTDPMRRAADARGTGRVLIVGRHGATKPKRAEWSRI